MKGSTISRRVSEFVGVALFAAALIWVVALASYEPSDPAWFFSAGQTGVPANFAGRVGSFVAELSFQLVGYAAYLIPLILVVVGWNYFWCRSMDAVATKAFGAALLFSCISAFLSLALGTIEVSGHGFRAGGYAGDWLAGETLDYLNRTGSLIVLLTLSFLAVIISTQFSFGRAFLSIVGLTSEATSRVVAALREWREERRREKQRQEVIAKHTKRAGGADGPVAAESPRPARRRESREADREPSPPPAVAAPQPARAAAPPRQAKVTLPAPPLPLTDPEPTTKAPAERRVGDYMLPPLALLDAPKTERKIDERELMDDARLLEEKCREFSVEGSVVQIHPGPVVTTYEFKPDAGVKYSKITGLADDLCLAM
ncbi:MAG: DNA translocase FtsK 4TM domain-containing protein, partial [Thermoanaerobaculia bacterium]